MVRHCVVRQLTTIAALVMMSLLTSTPIVAAVDVLIVAALSDENAATSGPTLRSVDPALVMKIQQRLKELGIYSGMLDGRMTEETGAAVRFYQRQSGMVVDGVVSRELLEHLDSAAMQAQRLLWRLEEARQKQTAAARQALENHIPARVLLAVAPALSLRAPAQTAREVSCLKTPSPDCLLDEALKAAMATGRQHFRDGAFRDVAIAWTAVGNVAAGIATAKRMSDPRLLIVVLGEIAREQADDGDYESAHTTALAVPDLRIRAQALIAVAQARLSNDRVRAARDSLSEISDAMSRIANPLWRTTLVCKVALLWAKLGDAESANIMLEQALEYAHGIDGDFVRNNALARVATAQAEVGRLGDALMTAASIDEARHRVPVLIKLAKIYAEAGEIVNALETAAAIGDARYRVTALISVALAQAHNDDAEAAQATLLSARMVGREINRGYSRSYALSHIARNQAAIGAIDDARETAKEVDRATLRAVALWAVAASPARHCVSVASCEDETLAFSAIRNLKDKLVRITLLSDIAVAYSRAGDRGRAIMLFDEALAYAVNLDKPWVRARALSRLATTLSEIR